MNDFNIQIIKRVLNEFLSVKFW